VLDSGVAADVDLTQAGNRIVASASFAGLRDPTHPDAGGHGTHIAGTIAGDGTRSGGQFVGVAPKANIADVQVLDSRGNGRISSVLRGMEWVLAHQAQYNIRVVNMSFGATSQGSYKTDPIAAGAEMLWKRGIIVVAAAGNLGPSTGTVEKPGIDPYVITVGSTDDQATLPLNDDTLAWFSAWGTPTDSTAKPDLAGPGRRVVSLPVMGSTLDMLLPDHVVRANNGTTYFRLTGTSMATAVVSGGRHSGRSEDPPATRAASVRQWRLCIAGSDFHAASITTMGRSNLWRMSRPITAIVSMRRRSHDTLAVGVWVLPAGWGCVVKAGQFDVDVGSLRGSQDFTQRLSAGPLIGERITHVMAQERCVRELLCQLP